MIVDKMFFFIYNSVLYDYFNGNQKLYEYFKWIAVHS